MQSLAARIAVPVAIVALAAMGSAHASHPVRGDSYDMVRCESHKGRDSYCRVDTRGGVFLLQQISSRACIEGRSWGWDRGGIWVSHGCRAEFAIGGRGYRPPPYSGGYGYPRESLGVRCESWDGRYATCPLPRGYRDAEVRRQLSRSACEEGYSWGLRRGAIWVDRGCRAEFEVY